jgi:hypothetical protein
MHAGESHTGDTVSSASPTKVPSKTSAAAGKATAAAKGRPKGQSAASSGATTRPHPAAAAPAASTAAASTADGAAALGVSTWRPFLHDWLRAAPAWLASMIVHIVLLLILGLMFLPQVKEEIQQLIATSTETKEEVIEEIQVDKPIEDVQVEEQATEFAEPVPTDNVQEQVEISPLDESAAATLDIQVAEIGAEMVPHDDLTKEVGSIVGRGLEGRGEAARKALVAQGGGNAASEEAVERALQWLARHQNPDGSWTFDHTKNQCQGRCGNPGNITKGDLGATALALLPFLGAGQTHKDGKYQRTVQMGLYYLVNNMKLDANGGSMMDEGVMYSHGIGAICLCEAYAMTQDRGLMNPAQQALNFIVYAQDKVGGGWRYAPGQPGDTSVVGWQLMALKSGHMAYLNVPPQTIEGISNFLNSTQADSGAAYGYTGPGNGLGTTAVGLLCRMYLGWKKEHPALERGCDRLGRSAPSEGNVYYNYYATQVLHHFGGETWEKWNKVMRDYLINTQSKDGHEEGSWFFKGGDHGAERGGRLYITALCCMTLEVYYRHLPIYGKASVENEFNAEVPVK